MDGFARGVAHYNEVKGKSVKVLGWDTAKKDGTFVGGFSDSAKALQISKNFEQQGADIIFPVAGGLGGATAGNSIASKKSYVIWVDTDGYVAASQYKQVLLSSVVKGVDTSVKEVILEAAAGTFTATGYQGNLENGGTYWLLTMILQIWFLQNSAMKLQHLVMQLNQVRSLFNNL